jgi:hypothetical protein
VPEVKVSRRRGADSVLMELAVAEEPAKRGRATRGGKIEKVEEEEAMVLLCDG